MITLSVSCVLSQVLILGLIIAQAGGQSNCISPDGKAGRCIGLRQCPQLLTLLQTVPLTSENVNFLKQSGCGFDGNEPRVCCTETQDRRNPEPSRVDATNDTNVQYDFSNNPLLPTDCGRDSSERIIGGERTDIDEFPWMALLTYRKPNGHTRACGGTLINRRYVLTAAHCVKGKELPKSWQLESVRLGEYDTSTTIDCIKDEDSNICADEVVDVGIEEAISHENYDPLKKDQKYDIALLRLNRDVQFTNYIKPICLPPTAFMERKLFVAGWGKTETGYSSNVKLKVTVPLVDEQQCKGRYKSVNVPLGFGQICAGGQSGKDSCTGDSGGPLMTMKRGSDGNGRWTIVGVVSFGPSPCGMLNWPGVYTRVIDFVPWILNKLRA